MSERGSVDVPAGRAQGTRMVRARKVVLALVFVAVVGSLAFDSGIGTPSAFGAGPFFLLCPLGGLEAMLADRSFIPVSAISMAVVLGLSLAFGRAWCAWGCPTPAIRNFFRRNPGKRGSCECTGTLGGCAGVAQAWNLRGALSHVARDSRTWVLVVVLAATLVAGLPLFCLVCPIGLTFGSVASLWNLVVNKQVTLSCVVFPAALLVEVVLYRRWCLDVCPVAGLLNVVGQFARLLRPRIAPTTCLRGQGKSCDVCTAVCPEGLDKHAPDAAFQLGECTRCGACAHACPTASITFPLK